jgi:hypothetical protein
MEGSLMNVARQGSSAESRPQRISSLNACPRRKPPILGFDRIVDNLAEALARTGARKVEAAVPGRPVSLAVDEEKMNEAFAILGNAMARDALVTIFTGLVGTETGEDGPRGCALLSVRVRGAQRGLKRAVGDSLPDLQGVIEKQGGLFRFSEGPDGEIRFSLYLPVLHG